MNPDEFFDLCDSGTAAQVREALDAGADVNARDEFGATALMHAAGNNEGPEVVAVLLNAGADR